jgi:hypothetical protein
MAGYSPEQQRTLLDASCDDVTSGKMPGPYTWLHPETTLSAADIETICASAHETSARDGASSMTTLSR